MLVPWFASALGASFSLLVVDAVRGRTSPTVGLYSQTCPSRSGRRGHRRCPLCGGDEGGAGKPGRRGE
ncbi:hypothetical protein PM082_016924 [Marasmius tenuissimus]|nr:hypothetical protein PM082_016924 [Marasmius tenuissimus]